MPGTRVTDAVDFYRQRGEDKTAVRVIRGRRPDKLRWRSAMGRLNHTIGQRRGKSRFMMEEPVREMVLDLGDKTLKREVVIDARRFNVDLDRGELLPFHRMGDLRRYAFLVGADMKVIERYVRVPDDFGAPIDTAGTVIVARAMANQHRRRAQRLWLELPNTDGAPQKMKHLQMMEQRAKRDAQAAQRWAALGERLLKKSQ